MPEHIKTAGDLRRGVAHLADSAPIEFFLNNVATEAYFGTPGVEGGDTVINVEPNYTCQSAPARSHVAMALDAVRSGEPKP